MDFHAQAVGHEAHDAGRFDPWNLLQLQLALRERNKKDVAADVAAHDFHDLRVGDVLRAADFNLVASIDAKAPGVLAVAVERGGCDSDDGKNESREGYPLQAIGSFLGK